MDGTCNFEVCYEEYRKFVLGTNNKVDWCVGRCPSFGAVHSQPTHPHATPTAAHTTLADPLAPHPALLSLVSKL